MTVSGPQAPSGAVRRLALDPPRLVVVAVSFLLAFGVALTWAAGTPMFAVPDEVSHMVRAAAAARGDLDGRDVAGEPKRVYRAPAVLIPADKTGARGGLCYAFHGDQSADCMVLSSVRREELIPSTASGTPPVYYLLVGWPSRLNDSSPGLYGMRAASAALFAAMLALAMTSLAKARARGLAYAGLAVALTPTAWFFGGSVNPSSAAIGGAVAAWCGGYLLVTTDQPPRSLAWRFGLPFCLLLLVRRDSILWAGLILVALALLVSFRRLAQLVRSRDVAIWAVASVLCAFYASRAGIDASSRFLGPERTGSVAAGLGAISRYVTEMIGVFGWLDTQIPWIGYILWVLMFGALFFAALGFARPRTAVATGFVVVALVVTIVAICRHTFPYYQGRYGLPLAVGAPLVAGLGLATDEKFARLPRRPVVVLLAGTAIVELLAYYHQFRRYAISGETTWWVFDHPRWQPPMAPIAVLLVLHLVAMLALATWWFARGTSEERAA